MSDRNFQTWLKNRLRNLDRDVKAPQSLKDKIRAGILEFK